MAGRQLLSAAALGASLLLAVGCDSTSPGDGQSLQVVAVGDIGDCPSGDCTDAATAKTADLTDRIDPDLVLTLGDNQYPSGELEDYQSEYADTWGQFDAITRPAPGNHDYDTAQAEGYFDYFGWRAAPDVGYYSFDAGGWHLVSLNSNDECEDLACSDGSAQQQWLADDLADTTTRCALAYWHHPRWSSGEHGDTEQVDALWRTAVEGGVDVVLNGHDHNYERFMPLDADGSPDLDGATELVVGTGGSELRPFPDDPQEGTEVRIENTHGVLHLELRLGSYEWEFIDVDGRVLDSGGPVECD